MRDLVVRRFWASPINDDKNTQNVAAQSKPLSKFLPSPALVITKAVATDAIGAIGIKKRVCWLDVAQRMKYIATEPAINLIEAGIPLRNTSNGRNSRKNGLSEKVPKSAVPADANTGIFSQFKTDP